MNIKDKEDLLQVSEEIAIAKADVRSRDYVWSVGGNVHDKGRAQFAADLRGRLAKLFSEQSMGLGWEKSETCYDCYVDTKTGKWADWRCFAREV